MTIMLCASRIWHKDQSAVLAVKSCSEVTADTIPSCPRHHSVQAKNRSLHHAVQESSKHNNVDVYVCSACDAGSTSYLMPVNYANGNNVTYIPT